MCQDCGLQCSTSGLFLRDGTDVMLFISHLISIRPPTCMCSVTAINLDPLTRPYDGPFRVLRRFHKHSTLDIKTKEITVDRLKPAKLIGDPDTVELPAAVSAPHSPTLPAPRENSSTPNQVLSHPDTTTRVGRPSRRPASTPLLLPLTGRGVLW